MIKTVLIPAAPNLILSLQPAEKVFKLILRYQGLIFLLFLWCYILIYIVPVNLYQKITTKRVPIYIQSLTIYINIASYNYICVFLKLIKNILCYILFPLMAFFGAYFCWFLPLLTCHLSCPWKHIYDHHTDPHYYWVIIFFSTKIRDFNR